MPVVMKIRGLIQALCIFLASTTASQAVDMKELEQKLTTVGVEGEIHGSSPDLGLSVFTYRNPKDFFDYINMSLVATHPEKAVLLKNLGRHDRVLVKGKFLDNPSPQKHIDIDSLAMVKKYVPSVEMPPYHYEAKIPDELLDKTNALFLVHGIHADGQILVVEYKDAVLPIFVRKGELAKNLFRNDLVRLTFKIQKEPHSPVHLRLDETAPKPIEVLEAIKDKHGKPALVEGTLVFFQKSPQIVFNIFALLEDLPDGLKRQYTLANFNNPEVFKKILAKLQQAWDRYPGKWVNGRNKLISTRIHVRAKGVFNEIDPNQANAQILLSSPDSIEILDK